MHNVCMIVLVVKSMRVTPVYVMQNMVNNKIHDNIEGNAQCVYDCTCGYMFMC